MYSKEFMKFLFNYQKDDFKPKTPEQYEIRFSSKSNGKRAQVYVEIDDK